MIILALGFLLCLSGSLARNQFPNHAKSEKPHIIIILADDYGWNDASFHGANQIPTPNLDALAYNGIILNNHYVQSMCTPSRSALMTGKYPIKMGMQHSVLVEPEPRGLPLQEKLLPQYLKDIGYNTYAIGKWHLGFFKTEYTPIYRGFDSFLGYWNGLKDYYSHLVESTFERWVGLDIRRNSSIAWDLIGKYSTDVFTDEAVKVIQNHDNNRPMFLYLSHLAVHSGNQYDPFQAPYDEVAKFPYIKDPERRVYAAMVSKMDQSIGKVIKALGDKGMLENSIVLFMSDNGAPTINVHSNRGSNYPFRGIKANPFEGGIRSVSCIWSPMIKKNQRVSNQMMHIVDWLPTLLYAAGINPDMLTDIDGINMWPALSENHISPRTEFLVNIDDIAEFNSVRYGDYKYISGKVAEEVHWYGEEGRNDDDPIYDPNSILLSSAGKTFTAFITEQQIALLRWRRNNNLTSDLNMLFDDFNVLTAKKVLKLRGEAEIRCNVHRRQQVYCDPRQKPCLYNIKKDPCEMVDISAYNPVLVNYMEHLINEHKIGMIPAQNLKADPKSNPIYWNNTWVNWRSELKSRETRDSPNRPIFGYGQSKIPFSNGYEIWQRDNLYCDLY